MLWCQPNNKILENDKLYEIIKSENMLFGWHQVLINGHDNKKPILAPTSFTETKWTFLVKLVIFAQQDAIEGDQAQQQ